MAIPKLYKDSLAYAKLKVNFWKTEAQGYKTSLDRWTKGALTKLLTKSMQKNRIRKLKDKIQICNEESEFWEKEVKHWEKKINERSRNRN